jgi:lactate racemase
MKYFLPYGTGQIIIELPDGMTVDVLVPDSQKPIEDIEQTLLEGFQNPLGNKNLEGFHDANSIGIAINDKTRPLPKPNPLEFLLNYLDTLGIDHQQITLFVGSGTHAPMTEAELRNMLGDEIVNAYPIIAHNCDHSPLINLGITSYGTPVFINEDFYRCDLKITVGNIEPHHFMGFSGGVKTAAIGLAGRETITINHAMLIQDNTRSGLFQSNPMRRDIEEIGNKTDIHFSLGIILDEDKHILQAFFGEPIPVMQAAVPIVRQIFGVEVEKSYDLVIASPGGSPKDINLYQAQKGMTHASRITKDGGWVILLAACPEGSGSKAFEDYVIHTKSHEDTLKEFNQGYFEVGPHKAFQIAREAVRVNILLVSDIPAGLVSQWKLTPSTPEGINRVIKAIISKLPKRPRIAILPAATRTMTEVKHG